VMLQFEPVFVQGAATLNRLLHLVEGFVSAVLRWLGGFVLACLEFAAHYPAIGLISLVVNALIVWWLTRTLSPETVPVWRALEIQRSMASSTNGAPTLADVRHITAS
jgi:hypothetical protein